MFGLMSRNSWYGWRPDRPDRRDFKFAAARIGPLPASVDLREGFPECYDQGDLGSCTANAIAAVLEFDQRLQGFLSPFTPSRLFIYFNERAMEGTVSSDAGAEIRDGVKSVSKWGAPREKFWPYVIGRFAKRPVKGAYADGYRHRSVKYERVGRSLGKMKECLASGFPFVFGFTVYDSFESDAVAQSGLVSMPGEGEGVVGGHAVCCVGYDDAESLFLCRNSWGVDWGMAGYFKIPYAYLVDEDLADDFWVIRRTR